jgi:hypothetical protein
VVEQPAKMAALLNRVNPVNCQFNLCTRAR